MRIYKKVIISFLILTLNNIIYGKNNLDNELLKRTISIMKFRNSSNIDEYNYLSNLIRNNLKNQLEQNKDFQFIQFSDIDSNLMFKSNEKNINNNFIIKKSIDLGSDVLIIGEYETVDDIIKVKSTCIDLLTGEKIIEINKSSHIGIELLSLIDSLALEMNRELSSKLYSVKKSYYKKQKKSQEKIIQRKLKIEKRAKRRNQKDFNFKSGNEITIGGGFFPFGYQFKYCNALYSYYYSGESTGFEVNTEPINKFFWGITVPFSYVYYLNKYYAIGFLLSLGYMPGFFIKEDPINENSFYFYNSFTTFQFNTAVKNKIGNLSNKTKFIMEYGFLFNFEISKKIDYTIHFNFDKKKYLNNGYFFISIGPKISLGLELSKKKFSSELLIFSAVTFGWQSFDDYTFDLINGKNIDLISGIEIRFSRKFSNALYVDKD